MDCVWIVICQGVESVKCFYCCDCVNMSGFQCEINNVEEEGVIFEWLLVFKGFIGDVVDGVMV